MGDKPNVLFVSFKLNTVNVKICNDVFFSVPIVTYVTKNFFLLDAINDKIAKINAAGFIKY